MKSEIANIAVTCSWVAMFAVVWLRRNSNDLLDAQPRPPRTKQLSPAPARRDGEARGAGGPDPGSAEPVRVSHESRPVPARSPLPEDTDWLAVDLFPRPGTRMGPRFDATVAHPVDAPQRLDAALRAVGARLRALPESHDLSRRSLAYRARLEQIRRDALAARARLAAGSYGSCETCTRPVSLARLEERPWARRCVYCELGI